MRFRPAFTIAIAILACLSGCSRGPFEQKWDKLRDDGSQTLADVEEIMGGKGTEIANTALAKEDEGMKNQGVFASIAEAYKGKRKLLKPGAQVLAEQTIADEDGAEVKWHRWDENGKFVYVAILDGKVFSKLRKGEWPKRE
jgi:hypothetical protein